MRPVGDIEEKVEIHAKKRGITPGLGYRIATDEEKIQEAGT